ncbi:S66 peptidase family protein [Tenacibaculum agarivorans]|uniref:S66 peptidase family protein n=1 Tax=Tenacibaculum agarivorans TaxID=1908389 RepID=UPI00094B7DBA|nr:LD-carboxypeptidase [Tenacibaculum agarivorans]
MIKVLFFYFYESITILKLITPPYLTKGDKVAIVAPAGILKNREEVVQSAIDLLENWGLTIVLGEAVFNQGNHFAGTDEERMVDFQKALDDPSIKMIWCARGGYGSVRIIDRLDFTIFKQHPKWIVGYSDITVFHNHVHNLGVETLHGIMCTSMQDAYTVIEESIISFKKAIFGERLEYTVKPSLYNREGKVSGQLVGGNLAILTSVLGSKSQLNTNGKILFIEEIGEYEYAIDRMLYSLQRAGYFDQLKGIIVGDISKVKENSTTWGQTIEELFLNILPKHIPIVFNFPAGHEPDNRALLMGREVGLLVERGQAFIKFT